MTASPEESRIAHNKENFKKNIVNNQKSKQSSNTQCYKRLLSQAVVGQAAGGSLGCLTVYPFSNTRL